MKKIQFITIGAVSLIVAGCIGTTKTVYYEHAQYGLVSTDHAAFVTDRDECAKRAYAEGITIKGQLITNRSRAVELFAGDFIYLNFDPSSYALAGNEGAMAVSSGDPSSENVSSATSSSRSQTFRRPDYADEFWQLEEETWDCVATKGWKKHE